jgi:hypothetical protein
MTGTRRTAATDLEALVDDYIQWLRPKRKRELSLFRDAPTDEDAISNAGLARDPETGKRLSHQRRIPPASLKESKRQLLKNLSQVRSTYCRAGARETKRRSIVVMLAGGMASST